MLLFAAMRSLDRIGQSARPEVLDEVMNADKTQNYIKSMCRMGIIVQLTPGGISLSLNVSWLCKEGQKRTGLVSVKA